MKTLFRSILISLVLLTSFEASAYRYSYSDPTLRAYRAAKRDAKTREQMANDPAFQTSDSTKKAILFVVGISLSALLIGIVRSNIKESKRLKLAKLRLDSLKGSLSENSYKQLLTVKTSIELNSKLDKVEKDIIRVEKLVSVYGHELGVKLFRGETFLGMTKQQLLDSRGKPTKIETEVLKTKTKEIYIYGTKSGGDIFVFVDEKLERFKDR